VSLGTAYDTKEQVRQAVDIADLIGSYVELRRQGRGYVALCPWHDDARPSLQINPDRQSWKCWVCDIGGDVFSFVMQREGVEFREALAMLADRAGISLAPSQQQAPVKPGSPDDKRTLYQAMDWAEKQFHEYLLRGAEAEPARKYFEQRGITRDSIDRFHLGFSPNTWQWLLDRARSTPFSAKVLEAAGMVIRSETSAKYYDRFKGRVIFSIRDTQRRPIAFGGRVLPEFAKEEEARTGRTPAKYINSSETRLFSKSDNLYGLDLARDVLGKMPANQRNVVVMEGYTDVVMAVQSGLDNATAVLGTALGPRHIRLLRRFADTITLVLDGDEAGQRRTNEILELFVAEQVDLRILTLPEGLDPCDFLLKQGADPFRELLASSIDALEHKVRVVTRGVDLVNDTHRANQALEDVLATVAKAPRLQSTTTTATRLREQQILSRLSREFRIAESELRARLNELRNKSKPQSTTSSSASASPPQQPLSAMNSKEVELIEILVLHPELAESAIEEIHSDQISAGPLRTIFEKYRDLCMDGETPDFSRVLTELEDPKLKNLLVELDERAHEKESQTQQIAPLRLGELLADYRRRDEAKELHEKISSLEQRSVGDDDALKILLELHERERKRHAGLNK
jgi:DNA primase